MALQEPKARESLLTPAMRRSVSKTSLRTTTTVASSSSTAVGSTPTSLTVPSPSETISMPEISPMPIPPTFQAINAVFTERTPFASDDAGDDDDDSDLDGAVGEDDDQVLNEVSYHYYTLILFDTIQRLSDSDI